MAKRTKQSLYVLNDNINSFNDVITILEMVMGFSIYQAEQIALLVHHKGEYPVLTASRQEMEDFEYILAKHGLTVAIK